jgi:Tol biopolymer transport system component
MKAGKAENIVVALVTLIDVVGAGAVVISLICFLLIAAPPLQAAATFEQTKPAVELEGAIAEEQVDGDLKTAIAVYQKIAGENAAPRDVRAKALMHLASCYEKLGQRAETVYKQVVRDFGDQPEAAQARARLAALKRDDHPASPATMTVRKIEWSALGSMDASDTDGQRAVYADSNGTLFFGDLSGHFKRMIFKGQPENTPAWNPSRDFSRVWLGFQTRPNQPATLAVVNTDGTGYRELVRDDMHGAILGTHWNAAWSWDNRYLIVTSSRPEGGGHLFIVSAKDGSRHELVSIETGYFSKAVFSPDGRSIACEVAPLPDRSETSQVFIVPAQGGEPHQIYQSAPRAAQNYLLLERWTLLDWTSDGRYLLVSDAIKGKTGLYLLTVNHGVAVGVPALVRYGDFEEAYTTASGSLIFRSMRPGGTADLFLTAINQDGHPEGWRRLDLRGGNLTNPMASFLLDGSRIAYVAQDEDPADGASLVLHELSSGRERVLYRSGRYLFCQSATHKAVVFCSEDKGGGTTDLMSVSVDSGSVQLLESFRDPKGFVRMINQASEDGHSLFLMKIDLTKPNGLLFRWNIDTKQETALLDAAESDEVVWPLPSIDGHWLIGSTGKDLSIRPISGGVWKPLVVGNCFPYLAPPDAKWVLYFGNESDRRHDLFRVSLNGGKPELLAEGPTQNQFYSLAISPDGRQLIATSLDWDKYDLWSLDNFVPPAAKH